MAHRNAFQPSTKENVQSTPGVEPATFETKLGAKVVSHRAPSPGAKSGSGGCTMMSCFGLLRIGTLGAGIEQVLNRLLQEAVVVAPVPLNRRASHV